MFRFTFFLLLFSTAVLFFSCQKDDQIVVDPPVPAPEPTSPVGDAVFQFDPWVGSNHLEFDTIWYRNSSKESFTVTKFNYYISNIRLKKSDGTYFSEPESYHLIKHVEQKNKFILSGIPEGNYAGIEFLIGVDSLRNVSGSQTGALDVTNNMFWEWNTGYIFYKLEGRYFDGNTPDPEFAIHIGGFSGPYKCLQQVSLAFPNTLVITKTKTSSVKLTTSVDEIFDTPRKISLSQYYLELPNGPKIFQDLSFNYKDMFKVVEVTN